MDIQLQSFFISSVCEWRGNSIQSFVFLCFTCGVYHLTQHSQGITQTILQSSLTGTAGGPGGRDRMLAVKSRKNARKSAFFVRKIKINTKEIFFCAYIL